MEIIVYFCLLVRNIKKNRIYARIFFKNYIHKKIIKVSSFIPFSILESFGQTELDISNLLFIMHEFLLE
jgi:hypothetical protein